MLVNDFDDDIYWLQDILILTHRHEFATIKVAS